MKKIITLLVCVAVVAVVFAACGNDDIYDRPGTGTTIGGKVTEPSVGTDSGEYSASPDGEVSETTDGVLEEGMEDVEEGLDDLGDGIKDGAEDLKDSAEKMADDLTPGYDAHSEEVNSQNNGNNNAGNTNGSTNGNSH